MFAVWRIGAIAALVNVKFVDEPDYYFADHQPTVVIYTPDMHEPVQRAAAGIASIRCLVCMDGPQKGATSLPELMAADFKPAADPREEDAIAHLSYTSGTTGKPKGACLRHEPTVRATRCIAERLRIDGDDVSFGPTALSSSYQLSVISCRSLAAARRFTSRFDAIDASGATLFVANPTGAAKNMVANANAVILRSWLSGLVHHLSCLRISIERRRAGERSRQRRRPAFTCLPGFDRLVAAAGMPIASGDRPILPLSLRPALLAGIAIVERSGSTIIAELHRRTMGAYHAHFGTTAAGILAPRRPESCVSFMQLI